jgi:hypothetical protein
MSRNLTEIPFFPFPLSLQNWLLLWPDDEQKRVFRESIKKGLKTLWT